MISSPSMLKCSMLLTISFQHVSMLFIVEHKIELRLNGHFISFANHIVFLTVIFRPGSFEQTLGGLALLHHYFLLSFLSFHHSIFSMAATLKCRVRFIALTQQLEHLQSLMFSIQNTL